MDLSLARVFQSPTVASLAEVIDLERSAAGLPAPEAPKLEVAESPCVKRPTSMVSSSSTGMGRKASLVEVGTSRSKLSFNQESMWVMYRTDPSRYARWLCP